MYMECSDYAALMLSALIKQCCVMCMLAICLQENLRYCCNQGLVIIGLTLSIVTSFFRRFIGKYYYGIDSVLSLHAGKKFTEKLSRKKGQNINLVDTRQLNLKKPSLIKPNLIII